MARSAPPNLVTLDAMPSWVNHAGRIDRSACLALPASWLRRFVFEDEWRAVSVAPTQSRTNPDWRIWPEARARVELIGETLLRYDASRPDRPLLGDHRTTLSNPLRYAGDRALHLPEGFTQTLRLERWRHNPILAVPYVRCPGCRGKKKQVLLVRCTPAEWRDAKFAALWLRTHVDWNNPLSREAAALLARYAVLLDPVPTCGPCLGVRYGDVKHLRRQHAAAKARAEAHTTLAPAIQTLRPLRAQWRRIQRRLKEVERLKQLIASYDDANI